MLLALTQAVLIYKGQDCQPGYNQIQGYCIQPANYAIDTKSTFMDVLDDQLYQVPVHRVTVDVHVDDQAVEGAPLEITHTGHAIDIMLQSPKDGLPKTFTLEAYRTIVVETPGTGQVSVDILVTADEPPMLKVRPLWSTDEELIRPSQDSINKISHITADKLFKSFDMPMSSAIAVSESLYTLQDYTPMSMTATMELEFEEEEVVDATLVKQNGIVTCIVKTAKRIYQVALDAIKNVFKAIRMVLKSVGVALAQLFKLVKSFFRWEDVQYSHQWLMANLKSVHDATPRFLETSAETTIGHLRAHQGDLNDRIRSLHSTLSGKLPKESRHLKRGDPQGQYLMNIMSQNAPMMEAEGSTSGMLSHFELLDKELAPVNDTLVQRALKHLVNGGKVVGIRTVMVLLDVFKAIFNVFDDVLQLSVEVVSRVLNAISEVVWLIMDFEVNVPFLSKIHKWVTKDERLTLLSVTMLPVAMMATWTYKVTHLGKMPFDGSETSTDLVTMADQNRLGKRVFAEVVVFIMTVLLAWLFFELLVIAFTSALILYLTMPGLLLMLLVFFIVLR